MDKVKAVFTGIYTGIKKVVDYASAFLHESFGRFTDLIVLLLGLLCLSFIAPAAASALAWWVVLISIYVLMFRVVWNAFSEQFGAVRV